MTELKGLIDSLRLRETYTTETRERMIAEVCWKWGTTRRKVLEYLKIVELV